jgi:serine/threonine-protein kinase
MIEFARGSRLRRRVSARADCDLRLTEQPTLYFPVAIQTGTTFGHYRIVSPIGAGGMGEVYLAEDTRLPRHVALKVLSADFTKDPERVKRFEQEARAASALNHPNIITIFEIDKTAQHHFIVTEYIEGEMLRQRINREPLAVRAALDVAMQAAKALAVAHQAGIIHRDIKPENLMLRPDGYVKVLDFGLAKLTEKSGEHILGSDPDAITRSLINTDPGVVMGTVSYMSPEQARGLKLDERTDIFSLGVVLYEMISGRKPFEAATVSDAIALILYKQPPPLARYTDESSAELERIVTKALAKDREERYQTVKDLAIDLKRLQRQLDAEAELERSHHPGWQPWPRASTSGAAQATERVSDQLKTIQMSGPIVPLMDSGAARRASSAEYLLTEIRRHKRGFFFSMAAVAAVVLGIAYFATGGKPKAIQSIAVLPFINASNEASSEDLSDRFTENIISNLSRLPGLRVVSFSAVARFKPREQQADPRLAGRELGARAVLTGRFTQRGDNLQISIELVDTLDNARLWGEQYTRKFADSLLVQEEIARDIAEKLRLQLSSADRNRFEAYQLYLKGRSYWNRRTPEALRTAIDYFEQANQKDANYALASAGLADCYNMLVLYSQLAPKEGFPKARAAAERALQIDDTLAEAHTALAFALYRNDWNWKEAERQFTRAIELNENYAPAHQWYANYLLSMGRIREALAEAGRAQQHDPMSSIASLQAAWVYYFAGQYDQMIETCRKTLAMDPNFYVARRYLGMAYEQKGMYKEAIVEFEQAAALSGGATLMKAHLGHAYARAGDRARAEQVLAELEVRGKQSYVSSYHAALIYAGLGEVDKAFEQLERAYDERAEFLVYLKMEPRLARLRADARFQNLLRRIGLPH